LSRSRLYRRLRNGPHGELVELYASRLAQEGLAGHGTWRCLNLVGDLLSWIARSRSQLTDLNERMVERYLRHRAGKQSIQPGDRAALKRWLNAATMRGIFRREKGSTLGRGARMMKGSISPLLRRFVSAFRFGFDLIQLGLGAANTKARALIIACALERKIRVSALRPRPTTESVRRMLSLGESRMRAGSGRDAVSFPVTSPCDRRRIPCRPWSRRGYLPSHRSPPTRGRSRRRCRARFLRPARRAIGETP